MALAGRGHYTEAAEQSKSLNHPNHPVELRSTALSLEASILRQQGEHAQAWRLDTHALGLLSPESQSESPACALARCDALTGVAADHLGLGGFDTAHTALGQVAALADRAGPADFGWRARVRWNWVTAETAMATGDFEGALVAAVNSRAISRSCPSLRHRVKSHLVFAAAQFLAQGGSAAQICANEVFIEAAAAGLVPLAWAAAMLMHAIEPENGWDTNAAALRGQWA